MDPHFGNSPYSCVARESAIPKAREHVELQILRPQAQASPKPSSLHPKEKSLHRTP